MNEPQGLVTKGNNNKFRAKRFRHSTTRPATSHGVVTMMPNSIRAQKNISSLFGKFTRNNINSLRSAKSTTNKQKADLNSLTGIEDELKRVQSKIISKTNQRRRIKLKDVEKILPDLQGLVSKIEFAQNNRMRFFDVKSVWKSREDRIMIQGYLDTLRNRIHKLYLKHRYL